jgi:hypothetical protein
VEQTEKTLTSDWLGQINYFASTFDWLNQKNGKTGKNQNSKIFNYCKNNEISILKFIALSG